jgi:hypothetical protein
MIKPSPLAYALVLRTDADHQGGILHHWRDTWVGCLQATPTQHHSSLPWTLHSVDTKACRIEHGLYYFRPMADSVSFCICSPLNAPPGPSRRKALEKRRLLLEKRKANAANVVLNRATYVGCAVLMTTKSMILMRLCTMWYFAYLVFVLVLCCRVFLWCQ